MNKVEYDNLKEELQIEGGCRCTTCVRLFSLVLFVAPALWPDHWTLSLPHTLPQALFCHVPKEHVLTMHDVSNIWRVPLIMEAQGAHHNILK